MDLRYTDPLKRQQYENQFHKQRRRELKEKIFTLLGDKCVCGFTDRRALCIDHTNNDGYLEIHKKGFKNYESYLRKILRSVEKKEGRYQILCANCNWIKRRERRHDNLV